VVVNSLDDEKEGTQRYDGYCLDKDEEEASVGAEVDLRMRFAGLKDPAKIPLNSRGQYATYSKLMTQQRDLREIVLGERGLSAVESSSSSGLSCQSSGKAVVSSGSSGKVGLSGQSSGKDVVSSSSSGLSGQSSGKAVVSGNSSGLSGQAVVSSSSTVQSWLSGQSFQSS
jgi:hypothetical protein